jgi:hypothetical protein
MNMKKIIFTSIFIFLLQASFACDICGCSSGNYFVGPFPWFHKHFVGIRYTFRSFHSILKNDETQFSKDFYQTAEVWGGWNIRKKWQLLAFLPYNINRQTSDDGAIKSNAVGDITVIANYNLLSNKTTNKHGNGVSQQLWIGAGLKLPTGKFSADADDFIPSANNQPGSGSVDLLLNSMYSLRINNWGISSNINYKINQDANNYQFGNRFSASAFVFRSLATPKATFNPNTGLLYENLQPNKLANLKVKDTGGNALFASAGMETAFNKIAVGFNAQLPVTQHLSNGQTTAGIRGMLHVTYAF